MFLRSSLTEYLTLSMLRSKAPDLQVWIHLAFEITGSECVRPPALNV